MKTGWRFVLLCFLTTPACTLTQTQLAKAELFDGRLDRLVAEYDLIQPLVTTRVELESKGFRLAGRNIETVGGAGGLGEILGSSIFQGILIAAFQNSQQGDPVAVVRRVMSAFNSFTLVVITYVDTVDEEDLIYWSTRHKRSRGPRVRLRILFDDGLVVYKDKQREDVDEHVTEHATGLGLLRLIGLVSEKIDEGKNIADTPAAFGQ